MACKTLTCSAASPLVVNGVTASSRSNNRVAAPFSVFFPSTCNVKRPASRLVAQATGDNKDTSVDVHVSSGQGGNNNQGSTSVDRRPRKMSLDVSPFGISHLATSYTI